MSEPKGITWDAQQGRWRARCGINGRRVHLGYYRDPAAAAAAYKAVRKVCPSKQGRRVHGNA